MSLHLAEPLKAHVLELCQHIRTPRSEGYFKSQDYLRRKIREQGLEPQDHHFNVFGLGECTNIYCEIGDSAKPRILIGAHYESRADSGPAADDNASACAVVLELIPLLKTVRDASFTVIFFDMEENYGVSSLRGSRAFCRWYERPLTKVIILDLVGGTLAPGFEKTFLQFGPAFPKMQHPEYEFLHLPMKIVEPAGSIGARSDYDEFRKRGIPHLFISSGTPWYYHTPSDTPDILSFEKMNALTEALWSILKQGAIDSRGDKGRTEDIQGFLKKFWQSEALRSQRLQRFVESGGDLSRLEITMLYWDILPKLRKLGPKLFQSQ